MKDLFKLILGVLPSLFKPRARLEAEILILRQQINVLRWRAPKRRHLNNTDRFLFVWLYHWFPSVLGAIAIVRPETIIRWHRTGFRAYWVFGNNWQTQPRTILSTARNGTRLGLPRSAPRTNPSPQRHPTAGTPGRPRRDLDFQRAWLRRKVFQPWDGGPLLRAIYLATLVCPISMPSLSNSPFVSFRLLYGLLIMTHGRRQILWFGVTAQPTAEWIANQLTAACGWEQIPRDLIRDRDACYGSLFVRRVRSLGIRDHPTSARSPWQNGYAERLIGSIRRECLDHIVVTGEQHLRHILKCYMEYYNAVRTHLSLSKDAPIWRNIQCAGRIEMRPVFGGLHHQYVRI